MSEMDPSAQVQSISSSIREIANNIDESKLDKNHDEGLISQMSKLNVDTDVTTQASLAHISSRPDQKGVQDLSSPSNGLEISALDKMRSERQLFKESMQKQRSEALLQEAFNAEQISEEDFARYQFEKQMEAFDPEMLDSMKSHMENMNPAQQREFIQYMQYEQQQKMIQQQMLAQYTSLRKKKAAGLPNEDDTDSDNDESFDAQAFAEFQKQLKTEMELSGEDGGDNSQELDIQAMMQMQVAQQMHRQQRERFMKEQEAALGERSEYELQLMRSLGADSVEEAMEIIQAAGIKPEDIPSLLMSNGLSPKESNPMPTLPEPPKLTRKQQLGMEPIPPELMLEI